MKLKNFLKHISLMLSASILMLSLSCISASAINTDEVTGNAELNAYIDEYMEKDKSPGLAVCIVNGSDTAFLTGGYDNIAEQTPFTETTRFELASVSKAFTALSVLLLQEEGKLSVTDPVSDYLPWFNVTWQGESYDVKIWQLLNHCSGLSESKSLSKVRSGTEDSLKEETARIAEGMELVYEPGTKFEYCNLGYNILAFLTETVSGQPFEEYVKKEILEPIGMKNSGYDIPTAQGYQKFFGNLIEYDAPRFKGCEGDGYLISTAEDMTLWINAQLGNLTLPDKLANAIERSHSVADESMYLSFDEEKTEYYANGWFLNVNSGVMSHSGGNPNFTTMLLIDRDKNIGVFAASNSQTNTPIMAAACIFEMLSGEGFKNSDVITDDTDMIASIIAVIGSFVMILLIVLMITQKKRLSDKAYNKTKEIIKLCIRLFFQVIFLIIAIALPYLLGYTYTLAAVWMPFSVLIALSVIDIDFVLMIISSIRRFIIIITKKM